MLHRSIFTIFKIKTEKFGKHSISCQSKGVTHYIALEGSNAHLWENESEKNESPPGCYHEKSIDLLNLEVDFLGFLDRKLKIAA